MSLVEGRVISTETKSTIPSEAQFFLERVKETCRNVCGDKLVSIRAFGSVSDQAYAPGVSDIDFLVLVADDCPRPVMDHLLADLLRLELAHNVAGLREVGALQRAFASRTVFFKSHFVFRVSTILSPDYHRLTEDAGSFDLPGGRILQRVLGLFLPWRQVLNNVISQSRLIDGNDSLGTLQQFVPWKLEARRVFLTCLGVTLLGMIHSLFSKDGTRLSLEGLKWYLIGESTCISKKRVSLSASLLLFQGPTKNDLFLIRFQALRKAYRNDLFFSMSCPFYITYLQLAKLRGLSEK